MPDQETEPGYEALKGAISTWREGRRGLCGPMRLAELAVHSQALSAAISSLPEDPDSSTARKEPVSCRKGCAACCRQVIPLSPPEAFLLAESVGAADPAAKAILLERFAFLAERLEREGLGDALFNRTADYFRLGLDCPFLVEESCSIHSSRPLACREHQVFSPAALCGSFPNAFIRMRRVPLSVGETLAELAAECLGTGMEMIPLSGGLQWASGQSESGERTWEAEWLLDRLAARCLLRMEYSAAQA
jgi:Fe-S-cluster containining protein